MWQMSVCFVTNQNPSRCSDVPMGCQDIGDSRRNRANASCGVPRAKTSRSRKLKSCNATSVLGERTGCAQFKHGNPCGTFDFESVPGTSEGKFGIRIK